MASISARKKERKKERKREREKERERKKERSEESLELVAKARLKDKEFVSIAALFLGRGARREEGGAINVFLILTIHYLASA